MGAELRYLPDVLYPTCPSLLEPGSHVTWTELGCYVTQASLELLIPATSSQVLGLQACITFPDLCGAEGSDPGLFA